MAHGRGVTLEARHTRHRDKVAGQDGMPGPRSSRHLLEGNGAPVGSTCSAPNYGGCGGCACGAPRTLSRPHGSKVGVEHRLHGREALLVVVAQELVEKVDGLR